MDQLYRIWKCSLLKKGWEPTSYVGDKCLIKRIIRNLSKSKYNYYEMRRE